MLYSGIYKRSERIQNQPRSRQRQNVRLHYGKSRLRNILYDCARRVVCNYGGIPSYRMYYPYNFTETFQEYERTVLDTGYCYDFVGNGYGMFAVLARKQRYAGNNQRILYAAS